VRKIALAASLAIVLLAAAPSNAVAGPDEIDQFDATLAVSPDGTLAVTENITFSSEHRVFNQAIALSSPSAGNYDNYYTVSDITATVSGAPAQAMTSETEGVLLISVTSDDATEFSISYKVAGAALKATTDETLVSWPVLQGLDAIVSNITINTSIPGAPRSIDCEVGPASSATKCDAYSGGTGENPMPSFEQKSLTVYDSSVLRIEMLFSSDTVAVNQDARERWSLDRAFSFDWPQSVTAALVLILGGLAMFIVHRRVGADAAPGKLIRVAEFHPIGEGQAEFRVLGDIRPGMVGTVIDEEVDPIDVTATLLDLAVRGYLRIEELPRETPFSAPDWTLTRIGTDTDDLADYERTLLDQLTPVDANPVLISQLTGVVAPAVAEIQSELYTDVVKRGWFRHNPHESRTVWGRVGWGFLIAAVIATILLAAFTSWALIGLALVLLGIASVFMSFEMPSRTAAGVGLLDGLNALKGILASQPVDQLPKGRELQQVSLVLPYAVVLGGYERWLDALVAMDDDDTPDSREIYWYYGPEDWHFSDLPASLYNFIITVQGTLFSR
jgi:hypothetical protein